MGNKPVDVRCAVCGEVFTAGAANAKYCPKCRKERQREQAAKKRLKYRKEREKQTGREQGWRQPDSPEQIEMCLNCTKPSCSGNCTLRKSAGPATSRRGGHRPRILNEAQEERVYRLRENGYKWREIAETMKVSINTVQRTYNLVNGRKENTE